MLWLFLWTQQRSLESMTFLRPSFLSFFPNPDKPVLLHKNKKVSKPQKFTLGSSKVTHLASPGFSHGLPVRPEEVTDQSFVVFKCSPPPCLMMLL